MVFGSGAEKDSMKSVTRKLGLPRRFLRRFQLQTQSSAVISLPELWNRTPDFTGIVTVRPSSLTCGMSSASSGSMTPIS